MVYQDPSGRGPSRRLLVTWGTVAAVVLLLAVIPARMYADGDFDDTITVVATADSVGAGLASGGDVKYRGYTVGQVASVQVTTSGAQRITMRIDRSQAPDIPAAVSAQYVPSNLLGVTGIELTSLGGSARLQDGDRIRLGAADTDVSVTTLLTQLGTISETITGPEVGRAIDLTKRIVDAVQPLARQGFDLVNLAASRQRMPLAEFLRILGQTSVGAADVTGPFVGIITDLVDRTSAYTDPSVVTGVTGSLRGLIQTISAGGGLVGDNAQGLAALTDFALTLGTPLGRTIGSIAPAVTDARELLRRVELSMPRQNGKVTLQVGVVLQQMPQITSVLQASGATPTAGGGR